MEKGYVIKGFGESDPLPNNLYFKDGENMTWIATFPDLHKVKDYLEYLNSRVLDKGFVAVKVEELEKLKSDIEYWKDYTEQLHKTLVNK